MKRLPVFFFLLSMAAWSQDTMRPLGKTVVQLETGMQVDWFRGVLSSEQVVRVTGWKELLPLSSAGRPDVTSTNADAPFFTLGVQRLIGNKGNTSWFAGMHTIRREISGALITVDSLISATPSFNPAGDSLVHLQSKDYWLSWQGRYLYAVLGARWLYQLKWTWVQIGANIAPGLVVRQRSTKHLITAEHLTVFSSSARVMSRTEISSSERVENRDIAGTLLACYASIPAHFIVRPASRWQFMLGAEPGITFVQLVPREGRFTLMTRVSFGMRYWLSS